MESSEITTYKGLADVKNYGIVLLLALLIMNGAVLGALHWVESNELRNELAKYAEALPVPDINKPEQTIHLPEDIIALRFSEHDRIGFYEISNGGQDYLAYADSNKHYVLMKSEAEIQKETWSFAIALSILYVGEVIALFGWWIFLRSKIREIFEVV